MNLEEYFYVLESSISFFDVNFGCRYLGPASASSIETHLSDYPESQKHSDSFNNWLLIPHRTDKKAEPLTLYALCAVLLALAWAIARSIFSMEGLLEEIDFLPKVKHRCTEVQYTFFYSLTKQLICCLESPFCKGYHFNSGY